MALSEKWKPVFENAELLDKVAPMKPEDAQKCLAENGYEFTMDEILEAGKEMYALKEKMTSSELSEDDLEDVAGGFSWGWLKPAVKTVAKFASYW